MRGNKAARYAANTEQNKMDSSQIRMANFLGLFKTFREANAHLPDKGMLKLFAEKLELSDRYLSHVKCGRKKIGSVVARQIEAHCGLEEGWMDHEHGDLEPVDALERNFIETALALYRSAPGEARKLMTDLLKTRLKPPSDDQTPRLQL